jgi:hypothetical protein
MNAQEDDVEKAYTHSLTNIVENLNSTSAVVEKVECAVCLSLSKRQKQGAF